VGDYFDHAAGAIEQSSVLSRVYKRQRPVKKLSSTLGRAGGSAVLQYAYVLATLQMGATTHYLS
jgi:hypothetical protein